MVFLLYLFYIIFRFIFNTSTFLIAISIIMIYSISPVFADENKLYKIINSNENNNALLNCRKYLEKYPSSLHNNEVRLILAAKTQDPYESITQYEYIYKHSKSSSYKYSSFISLLELYFLTSQYDKTSMFQLSRFNNDIKSYYLVHYLIKSQIVTFDYDNANYLFKKYNYYISESCNNLLSQVLLYKTGKKSQISKLPQINASQLYFIAKEYYAERKYDYAFSAYADLQNKYTRSPEAIISKNRYVSMSESHYKYNDKYLSDNYESKIIDLLSPEVNDNEENNDDIHYSVVFGPFISLNDVRTLKKELRNDYVVLIIKKNSGYFLYAGNEPTIDRANTLKIRLAEEFGLNGKIVQKIAENGREYIYGD
jgi:hypothetical protein